MVDNRKKMGEMGIFPVTPSIHHVNNHAFCPPSWEPTPTEIQLLQGVAPASPLEHLEEVVRRTSCNTQHVECWSLLRAKRNLILHVQYDGPATEPLLSILWPNSRSSQSWEDFSEETICYMYMVCTCLWSCVRELSFCLSVQHIYVLVWDQLLGRGQPNRGHNCSFSLINTVSQLSAVCLFFNMEKTNIENLSIFGIYEMTFLLGGH